MNKAGKTMNNYTPSSNGNPHPKPLFTLGDVLPDCITNPENVPDLSGKTKVVGQTGGNTLIGPTKVNHAHRIVFVLAKAGASLHREEIARRAEIPIASLGCAVAKLTQQRVLLCPEWGCYALSKDFLRQFQYAYGASKTETLLKLLDEGGVDIAFEFSLNEKTAFPAQPAMLDSIKGYLESQRNRIVAIGTEIQKLTEEKTAIESEMASIGQMIAPQIPAEVKEAA